MFYSHISFLFDPPQISRTRATFPSYFSVYLLLLPFTTTTKGLCLLNVTLRAHRFFLPTRAKLFVATACAYIVFGAFVFGLTTCQAVMQFIRAFTTHPSNLNSIPEARYDLNNLLHAGHVK
ncbi:hypothetical protein FGIG_09533 [Fasciola gigantica]|uniref:Uncharacterized protein n=1 Tax=Fasciola gigantica TaxID=46835 RepID=A0A504Y646_FASGI|nr:hypothetical protein FGIG_09533 [Fasciola gigantica]